METKRFSLNGLKKITAVETSEGNYVLESDYAALKSFCEGLKGVTDELRGKLSECEKDRDDLTIHAKEFEILYRGQLARAEAAEARCKRLEDAIRHHCDVCDSSFSKVAALRQEVPESE